MPTLRRRICSNNLKDLALAQHGTGCWTLLSSSQVNRCCQARPSLHFEENALFRLPHVLLAL